MHGQLNIKFRLFYNSHVHLHSLIPVSVRNVPQSNSPHIFYLNVVKPTRRLR